MVRPAKVQQRIKELSNKDAAVRRKAAKKLGEYADVAGVEALCHALHDRDAYVRSQSATALGRLRSPAAFDPLREALNDLRPGMRHAAAWSLGQVSAANPARAKRAVFFIVHAAAKSKPEHFHNYVHALVAMGAHAVGPLTLEYNSFRSPATQDCAQQALVAIDQQVRTGLGRTLLADPELTAPQQWSVLEMLASQRPRTVFTPRQLTDARRFCELIAADTKESEAIRRGAAGILDYLSLGRASQRYETTDAQQLLRMAGAETTPAEDGRALLRGAQGEQALVEQKKTTPPEFRWIARFRQFLAWLRRHRSR